MKEKTMLIFIAMAMLTLAFAPTVKAAPNLEVYGYTDKIQYKPGESGTVKFWIYNWGPDTAVLKNVTIEYPWYSPIWGGNQTITLANVGIAKGENYSNTDTFKIPEDARAEGGPIVFRVYYEFGGSSYSTPPDYVSINVATAPSYESLQGMDNIITLFTIQTVLIIVCTIIIAATIFLARRPQVMWRKEEKAE